HRRQIYDRDQAIVRVEVPLYDAHLSKLNTVVRDLRCGHDIDFAGHRHDPLAAGDRLPGRHAFRDLRGGRAAIDLLPALARLGIGPTPVSLRQQNVARGDELRPWNL